MHFFQHHRQRYRWKW